MKKALGFLVFSGIGLVLFAGLIQEVGWSQIWQTLARLSGIQGIFLVLLSFVIVGIGNLRWKEILRMQGYRISFFSLFQPFIGAFCLTFVAPMAFLGGELFRSYALQKVHNVPFSKALASTLIDRILELTSYLVVIIVGVIFFLSTTSVVKVEIVLFILAGLFVFGTGLAFFYLKSFKKESIVALFSRKLATNNIGEIEQEIFHFFRVTNRALWEGLALSFLKSVLALVRVWILVLFLGEVLGLLPSISILSFFFIALFIPIPAALGTHDALQAFAFQALNGGAHMGAAFALVVRTADLLVAVVGAVFVLHVGVTILKSLVTKVASRFVHGK